MSWTLNASGHCASEEDERALVAELNRALSSAAAGTASSGFVGQYHAGPAHGMPDQQREQALADLRAEESRRAQRSANK